MAPSPTGVSSREPAPKLLRKDTDTSKFSANPPVPRASVKTGTTSSPLPTPQRLAENTDELEEEFRKHLKAVIPDQEKGVGTVWRTHLPKDYPDSLGVYFPGYTNMQQNLNPSMEERALYAREAFRVTSSAEERKLVEEDSLGALGRLMHYQHQSGVITGAIWDKLHREDLQLQAPHPGVPPSSAAIIERDFFKEQMLSRNRLANIRLEEILMVRRENDVMKVTMQKQQAALKQSEADLAKANARAVEAEKRLASQEAEVNKLAAKAKKQEEELPRQTLAKFLTSRAFTTAARISCDNFIRAAIYRELKDLSELYPFDPERVGFVEIPEAERVAGRLPGYTWDEENDRLLTPKGKKIKPPDNFEMVPPTEIPITWRAFLQWPIDVNDPSKGWIEGNEEEQEDANLNEVSPNLQVEVESGQDPISPGAGINPPLGEDQTTFLQETGTAATGSEAGTSAKEPGLNVEDGTSSVPSPRRQSD